MNDDTGTATTSTYYAKDLPAWVTHWNGKKLADTWFGKTWDKVAPPAAYAASQPDNAPNEGGGKGLGKTFPHTLNGKLAAPGPDYYEALCMSPYANDWEFAFAQAAIEGENLGGRGVPESDRCLALRHRSRRPRLRPVLPGGAGPGHPHRQADWRLPRLGLRQARQGQRDGCCDRRSRRHARARADGCARLRCRPDQEEGHQGSG